MVAEGLEESMTTSSWLGYERGLAESMTLERYPGGCLDGKLLEGRILFFNNLCLLQKGWADEYESSIVVDGRQARVIRPQNTAGASGTPENPCLTGRRAQKCRTSTPNP